MRFIAVLLIAVLLTGCASARVQIGASSGTSVGSSSTSPGTRITSGSAGLQVQGGSNSLAVALVVIALVAGTVDFLRNPQPLPSPSTLLPKSTPPAPELATDRPISVQDCSQPLDYSKGNIVCK